MRDKPAILVAGGAGYIGSHCCKGISEVGYLPICYDNLSTGHDSFVQWGPLVVGDIHDCGKIASTIREHDVVAVLHFAASSAVGESVTNPEKYYFNNVGGTLELLRGMLMAGCKRIVFSSTGAVYGQGSSTPLPEQSAGFPINPYGRSKLVIEQILADYRAAYQLGSVSLRYFNACGADAAATIGELRDHETHLVPRALMALQGHVSDFAVFGTDYDTVDGTAVRDYVHVEDLAAAHISALRLLAQGNLGDIFNVGTGVGYSVREVLEAIRAETGEQVPLTLRQRRSGDPPMLIADPRKARSQLQFEARHSDLANIIRSAWRWHQKAHPRKI